MSNKKYIYGFMTLTLLATLATAVPALADTTTSTTKDKGAWGQSMRGNDNRVNMKPAVFGTVSAVSGNTITVAGKQGFDTNAVATTFTVDATNAKITKNNVVGTVSSILVGDTVMAQGTLTGTNLVATTIRDGQTGKEMRGNNTDSKSNTSKTPPVSPITGNGQPIVAGIVSSISGSTITITNKSNVSYTVDTTNAKIVQGTNTILISNVVVGDMIVVQGTVNGNTIVASSVINQTKPVNTTTQQHKGFFAGIGSFFASIFGF
jgi:hypothetical protein